MKIAVIGGGIAGLSVAWMLSRQHAVTLFERHAQPGFVASSVAVDAGAGLPPLRVDVPLRVFYPGYYPTLTRLYQQLGVTTEPVSYATTFTGADGRAFFRWRNLRWGDSSWPYVLPQDLAGARARRIVAGALRFNRLAQRALVRGELGACSIGTFVDSLGLPADYVQGLLLPALATIATCSTEDARQYPADVVAGYLAGGLTRQSVRRAVLGADDACQRLLAGITHVQCEAGVSGLRHETGLGGLGCAVQVQRQAGAEQFDHVVLATQANQALALWQDATPAEAAVLRGFSYRTLEVVMHRDAALMPVRRTDWSPVNARVCAGQDRPESTIWVNAVQPALRRAPLALQTVQPQRPVREDLVISRARFERPVVDAASQRALAALQQLQAQAGRRVWLCGSYAQPGVPLLESAVRSACVVAQAISGEAALAPAAA